MDQPTRAVAAIRAAGLLGLLFWVVVVSAEPPTRLMGTYTSLTFNAESGDLHGYEVKVVPTRHGLKALLQAAEGEPGDVFVVDVAQKNGEVSFEVPLLGQKPARFQGRLVAGGLKGKILYSSGSSEDVFLKHARSYWDRE